MIERASKSINRRSCMNFEKVAQIAGAYENNNLKVDLISKWDGCEVYFHLLRLKERGDVIYFSESYVCKDKCLSDAHEVVEICLKAQLLDDRGYTVKRVDDEFIKTQVIEDSISIIGG